MAGIGRFKLSDALPKSPAESSRAGRSGEKKKTKAGEAEQTAEQLREAREATLARNSEAGGGRSSQQVGRQRGGGRGK